MSKLKTYDQLQKWLKVSETSTASAEFHGWLCGLIVGSCVDPKVPILQTMLDYLQNIRAIKSNDQGIVAQWSIDTFHELQSQDFLFYPRLPSDQPLPQRLAAAGAWCQAFTDALTDCGIWPSALEGDAKEALEDLISTAQVDTQITQSTEEDEAIYEDLAEHIKICVLIIFTSLTSTTQASHDHDCHCCKHDH